MLLSNAAWTCILVILVLVISCLILFRHATDSAAVALKAIAVGFGIAAMIAVLICHFVDPGTPERDPNDPGPEDEMDNTQRIRECCLPDGQTWNQKWCRECKLWRPYRCGHCHKCGRCVLRLDHHCDFMGTCVGERNLRFFSLFLFCAGMGIIFLCILAVHHLTVLGCWTDPMVWGQTFEPIAIVIFFMCCPPIPCLCLFNDGLALAGASLGYSMMMLADTNLRSNPSWNSDGASRHERRNAERSEGGGKKFTYGNILIELQNLFTCQGVRIYCLGPLTCKAPVGNQDEQEQPIV